MCNAQLDSQLTSPAVDTCRARCNATRNHAHEMGDVGDNCSALPRSVFAQEPFCAEGTWVGVESNCTGENGLHSARQLASGRVLCRGPNQHDYWVSWHFFWQWVRETKEKRGKWFSTALFPSSILDLHNSLVSLNPLTRTFCSLVSSTVECGFSGFGLQFAQLGVCFGKMCNFRSKVMSATSGVRFLLMSEDGTTPSLLISSVFLSLRLHQLGTLQLFDALVFLLPLTQRFFFVLQGLIDYFTGYPKCVFAILGNEFCERFSFYGMKGEQHQAGFCGRPRVLLRT